MGRRKNPSTVEVHPGLYLKRSDHAGPWQCYFRLDGKQFRKSTKSEDLLDAKFKALRWYNDARSKIEVGIGIERVPFSRLVQSYLAHIRGLRKFQYHSDTLKRHFQPFFNKFSDVAEIRTSDFLDYIAYRRAKKAVLPQTLNRENTVFRQLMKFAEQRGWIKTAPTIEHFNERLTRRRRPHFTIPEYMHLCHVARERIDELRNQPLQTVTLWRRELLYDLIKVLINTGLRVNEALSLSWRNVDFERRQILVERSAKTNLTRTIWVRSSGIKALGRIRERRLAFLSEHGIHEIRPNEKVFCLEDGTAIKSFKKGFYALLSAAGFEYETIEQKHTLTSLRHSYATFGLTTKRSKRATIKSLSLQLGTSVRMIEQFYGHDQILDYQEELAGTDLGHAS
jgi:integrase